MLNRADIIQNLQRNRFSNVHLLDAIPKLLPNGVTLISIKRKASKVEIQGIAKTNSEVSAFLRNLEDERWQAYFSQVKLNEVAFDNFYHEQKFKLQFFLVNDKEQNISKETSIKEGEATEDEGPMISTGAS